jgi:DNA/RNA-binding domain of Phe-tRNA-synthetase-like protein
MNITISEEIKRKTPQFSVGVLTATVSIFKSPDLDRLIDELEHTLNQEYNISDVVNLEVIKEGRDAYKVYGKDPSRYRLAVESLYRRIVKGNALYRINNVVDIGNVLSLKTRKSIAVLDYDNIQGDVFIRLGTEQDKYEGIGRGQINISNIPLYEDEIGPFGSTTSDTVRTMITNQTKKILVFIISFTGNKNLPQELELAEQLFEDFASGVHFTKDMI